MSDQKTSLNIGLSKAFPCSYLDQQEEQLLMLIDPENNAKRFYPLLLAQGFRRSGDAVYRPHCQQCSACQSIRIPIRHFAPSRSQKRLSNKNKAFTIIQSQQVKACYYDLYENYINQRHSDGVMFPATQQQFNEFIHSSWNNCFFLEIYDQNRLICVAITDIVTEASGTAWSAFYCFYDPTYSHYSLGKFALLTQLKLAKKENIDWLYLGYYIKDCRKMNYKTQFTPHQRFINGQWLSFL
ncbi:arginyltransferase [Psychromonas sp. MME2]|uniref:arginyltransferase n=1 Tax=unclassified Psychromonas TaxID=2614957 RepID=UPI00339BE94B